MSNNTKRLSFFAKIAQRSTALQSLLEEATGKSARDSQGNVIAVEGMHDGHKPYVMREPYATERYQKDIEVAQAQPTPPVVVEPAGIRAIGSSAVSSVDIYASRYSDGDDENPGIVGVSKLYAWSDGPSTQLYGTASANPAQGSVVYYKFYNAESGVWSDWSTTMGDYTVTTGSPILGPCIGVDCVDSGIGYAICIDREPEAGAFGWDFYMTGAGKLSNRVYTLDEEPESGASLYVEEVQVGTVVAYSNITSDVVSPSNDPSAESINPNLESRIKHVKEFYRGESHYFMHEVGLNRYPNHYHVAWTVPSVADGTLSATADGYPLFNGEAVIEGATIVFTATPASGKQFGSWTGLPQGATTSGNTATFTLAAEVNVSATFTAAAVTSFMEYYFSTSGNQYIHYREPSLDTDVIGIQPPEGKTKMYAWVDVPGAETASYYTDTLSLTADMNCENYQGTHLWYLDNVEGWIDASGAQTIPNERDIIASIDPHMYQNIKIYDRDEGSVYVMSRKPESDSYDTADGKVLIAWYSVYNTLYTKSLDIEVSPSEEAFGGTHLWYYDEGSSVCEDATESGWAEIREVHEIQPLRFESATAGAEVTIEVGTAFPPAASPTNVKYRTKTGGVWNEWNDYEMDKPISMPCEFIADSWCVDEDGGLSEAVTAYVSANAVVSGNITALWGRYGTLDNTIPEPEDGMLHHMRYLFYSESASVSDASNLILADNTTAHCYDNMFSGCTSLAQAPTLPAPTLTDSCYYEMFCGCTSLNAVHCAATDISADDCTSDWLYGVSASGDFYGRSVAGWSQGESGIPSGWTVHEE